MLTAPGKTVHRARRQRREMSLVEIILWRELRKRPGGFKFRKLHPVGHFVIDFFCAAAKLAIEIDGEAHNRGDQPKFDDGRDTQLASHGIQTLRIRATDILRNLDGTITHIVDTARSRLPLHPPPEEAGGPPPRSGEELERILCP